MSPRTVFLGRLIGIYSILVPLAMAVRGPAAVEIVKAILRNPPLTFLLGLIGLSVGLAIILGHNVWSGGTLPVLVTVIGWITLVKGLLLLFLPPQGTTGLFLVDMHYEQFFYVYVAFSILLGVFLTSLSARARI
jgi:hypothetical protein